MQTPRRACVQVSCLCGVQSSLGLRQADRSQSKPEINLLPNSISPTLTVVSNPQPASESSIVYYSDYFLVQQPEIVARAPLQ
jgi:hypothetical protein